MIRGTPATPPSSGTRRCREPGVTRPRLGDPHVPVLAWVLQVPAGLALVVTVVLVAAAVRALAHSMSRARSSSSGWPRSQTITIKGED